MAHIESRQLHELWSSVRCIDLVKRQSVIVIDSEASVTDGCRTLVEHDISSAPVFNKKTGSYVGMLDYRDIVDFVLIVFRKKQLCPIGEDDAIGIDDIVHRAVAGDEVSVQVASDLSRKNPFYSVMLESSVEAAIDVLASGSGVHRVNVVDANGIVKGVLSQTDVVRYLLSKIDGLAAIFEKTLEDLGLAKSPVVSVKNDATVLDALERMSEFGVSSIAVVDSSDYLLGNISMADIRFVFQNEHFNRLWLQCQQFVQLTLDQKGLEHHGQDSMPVFDVRPDSTLTHAVRKMLATHVHRLWVVDSNQKLCGVVSLTDVIHLFLPDRPM